MSAVSTVLIAANPKSGAVSRQELVAAVATQLQATGRQVEICENLSEVEKRSHQLEQLGCLEAVVSAGGDGTAAAVVNLIPTNIPLALFPLGTENLLARHLGISAQPAQVASAIAARKVRSLDAGQANGRIFLVMVGCGFDAEVVAQMHKIRRGHINRWSYAKPIWRAIRNYHYPSLEVDLLDETAPRSLQTAWLFAFNLPRYAANLAFCPQAIDDDGRLDLCAFTQGGLGRGLYYLANLWCGRHQHLSDFCHVTSSHFRVQSDQAVPYQIDGDPGGYLPLEVSVLPGRLRLIVP